MIDINRLLQFAAIFALLAPLPARADFRIGGPAAQTAPDASNEAEAPPAAPRFKTVIGYGNNVPLDFAAKQIVPTNVRLRFGAGVDRDALVTWRGNAPWNHVLAQTVRALGLHVRTGATEVTILR